MHTRTDMHRYMHAHTETHTDIHTDTHIQTHAHTSAHTYTLVQTHAHTQKHPHTLTCTQIQTCTHRHTHMNTQTYACSHTQAHVHMRTHNTRTHACMHRHAHRYTQTYTYMHTHVHTHPPTEIHMHTQTPCLLSLALHSCVGIHTPPPHCPCTHVWVFIHTQARLDLPCLAQHRVEQDWQMKSSLHVWLWYSLARWGMGWAKQRSPYVLRQADAMFSNDPCWANITQLYECAGASTHGMALGARNFRERGKDPKTRGGERKQESPSKQLSKAEMGCAQDLVLSASQIRG